MLEKSGISFYPQTLRGVMVFFGFVVALGFTTPVSAAGAGFCNSHPGSFHCHIVNHGDDTDFVWDLIVEIIDADGGIVAHLGFVTISHAEVATLDPEELCIGIQPGDYTSSTLFIDLHTGENHNHFHDHEPYLLSDGENFGGVEHYHILTATCTLGQPLNHGAGKGKGKNK